jgi:hypothetical protein
MGEAEREEERRYLSGMENALGPRVIRALHDVARVLALDYAGIDFGISFDGELVVFEANAAMTVHMPDSAPDTEYRRAAAARIFDAAQRLIRTRAEG